MFFGGKRFPSIDQKISTGEHVKPLEKELKKNTDDTLETKNQVKELKGDLEEHRKKLDEIHKLVQGFSNAKAAPGSTQALEKKIDDLAENIRDLIPVLKSIDSSTKRMLEINKKVLLKK